MVPDRVVAGERVRDRGDVLEFPLDRVGGCVAGRAPAPTIHREHPPRGREARPDRAPRRVIGGGAVHEQERRVRSRVPLADGVSSAR